MRNKKSHYKSKERVIVSDLFESFVPAIKNCPDLIEGITIKNFKSNEVLVHEKDQDSEVGFILSGKVKVISYSPTGDEVWHNTLIPGQTFGEMAAISHGVRCATVVTIMPSKIGYVSQERFLEVLNGNPDLSFHFLQELVSRLQLATQHTNEIVAFDIPTRTSAELLRQSEKEPAVDGTFQVNPDLTVTKLAEQLNSKRETVSRTLSTFVSQGYIEKRNRKFFILDRRALLKRAGEI